MFHVGLGSELFFFVLKFDLDDDFGKRTSQIVGFRSGLLDEFDAGFVYEIHLLLPLIIELYFKLINTKKTRLI